MISLCEISPEQIPHCFTGISDFSSEREMLCDWVQHKCQLSDLPLMRWHLWQEGRKLLLWKTHGKRKKKGREKGEKNTHVLLLRVDKETLKGIKLFYISYICMSPLKCSTLFIYTVLGLWVQLRWRGIESVTVHQRRVQSEASSHSINVTPLFEFVLTQLIAPAVKSNIALSELSWHSANVTKC